MDQKLSALHGRFVLPWLADTFGIDKTGLSSITVNCQVQEIATLDVARTDGTEEHYLVMHAPHRFGGEIMEAFGMNPSTTAGFTLRVAVDDAVHIQCDVLRFAKKPETVETTYRIERAAA